MEWSKVATVATLVTGSLIAAALNKDPLAMVLVGAAAGFVAQSKSEHKRLTDKPEG